MSGGVDSSVAAFLLQKDGYEVVGLHFSLTGDKEDLSDLDNVAKRLGIRYYTANFRDVFSQNVFEPFLAAYRLGSTPNICVLCNRFIKFGALIDKANELNCDYIATGHYCSLVRENGTVILKKAADETKDQTYFLARVNKTALSKTIFPLYGLTKEHVREIARENNIPTAAKKDSFDVCLAGNRKFADFLSDYMPTICGDILTTDGEKVGTHNGLYRYTLGQRKGLDLGGKSGEDGRWFVVGKDIKNNILYVSHGSQDLLFTKEFDVRDINFITEPKSKIFDCTVKTRYRSQEKQAVVSLDGNAAHVMLKTPERAVTSGQTAAFYVGDVCLGGGEIL